MPPARRLDLVANVHLPGGLGASVVDTRGDFSGELCYAALRGVLLRLERFADGRTHVSFEVGLLQVDNHVPRLSPRGERQAPQFPVMLAPRPRNLARRRNLAKTLYCRTPLWAADRTLEWAQVSARTL